MQKSLRYTIFKTKWGYFGLVGTEYALYRTCLPGHRFERTKRELLKNLSIVSQKSSIIRVRRDRLASAKAGDRASRIENDKNLFRPLQEQITAYFEGACVNFDFDIPIVLNGFSRFCSSVLTTCRDIGFGQTISYSGLAKKIGRPAAARAVGNALARNPLPLIIPCHRVVRSPRRFASQSEAAGGKPRPPADELVPAQARIGGFSAPGGVALKKRLLSHEQNTLRCHLHS